MIDVGVDDATRVGVLVACVGMVLVFLVIGLLVEPPL